MSVKERDDPEDDSQREHTRSHQKLYCGRPRTDWLWAELMRFLRVPPRAARAIFASTVAGSTFDHCLPVQNDLVSGCLRFRSGQRQDEALPVLRQFPGLNLRPNWKQRLGSSSRKLRTPVVPGFYSY